MHGIMSLLKQGHNQLFKNPEINERTTVPAFFSNPTHQH